MHWIVNANELIVFNINNLSQKYLGNYSRSLRQRFSRDTLDKYKYKLWRHLHERQKKIRVRQIPINTTAPDFTAKSTNAHDENAMT